MADIELVIKINENTYHRFINGFADEDDATLIEELFKNATPLPKEHGRLIDADALKKDDEVTEWLSINPIRTGKMLSQFSKLFVKKIDDAPTIIEADKENEE